jgi:hypothetical protein
MIKINDLIAALQEQQRKYGNIELSIEVALPEKEYPKGTSSHYYHMFGPWYLAEGTKDGKSKLEFRFHEDTEGDWLDLEFTGRIEGEWCKMSRQQLRHEAKLDWQIG